MSGVDNLVKRIAKMRAMSSPNSPEMKAALTRVSSVLKAEIRLNIVRQKITDFGGLINSIRDELTQSADAAVMSVGSFGIKYAAMNEFGGPMSHKQVAAMFAAIRRRKGVHPKSGVRGKGVVTIYRDGTGFWRPRPYIRPALQKHKNFVIDVIRSIGE